MGDPSNKGGIPSWQKVAPETSAAKLDEPKAELHTVHDSTSLVHEESTFEQAVRFLREESIRDAPLEQKKAFLASRSVKQEDIDRATALIEAEAKHTVESSSSTSTSTPTPESFPESQNTLSTTTEAAPPPLPSRDIPPIITYPEFLTHSTKPPPLITATRLLNTAYIASGIAAAIYGASKYLVTPSVASLTDARHDFALHAQSHLTSLNEKLGTLTSPLPSSTLPTTSTTAANAALVYDADDASSASDPTELFHRDYGTQTAPELDEDNSSSDTSLDTPTEDLDAASQHAAKLKRLHALCTELVEESDSNGAGAKDISDHLDAFRSYLDDLHYPIPNIWQGAGAYGASADKESDGIARFKNEIRSVKGYFLNARNFPSSSALKSGRVPTYG